MGVFDRHAHIPYLFANTREAVTGRLEAVVLGFGQFMVNFRAHTHDGTHLAPTHGLERFGDFVEMAHVLSHATAKRGSQVKIGKGVDLDADGVVLKDRHGFDALELFGVVGDLPGFLLIRSEQHHLFVDVLTGGILHIGVGLIVGHPQHHIGESLLGQVMPFPDVVAQVVSEVFIRGDPVDFELHAHFLGNPATKFDVDAPGLTIYLVRVRREILVDADFQIAGVQNDVVGAFGRSIQEFVAVVNFLSQDHLGKQQKGKHSSQCFHCYLPTTKGRHKADPNSGIRFGGRRNGYSGLGSDST